MHHENGNQSLFCCPLYNSSSITKRSRHESNDNLGAWSQRIQPVSVPGRGRQHRSFFFLICRRLFLFFMGICLNGSPFTSTIHEQQSCVPSHAAILFTSSCPTILTCDSSLSPLSCMIASSTVWCTLYPALYYLTKRPESRFPLCKVAHTGHFPKGFLLVLL